jgi:hypothetical protein
MLKNKLSILENRRVMVVIFAVVFALVGVLLIVMTRAATPTVNFEAESGNRSGNATVISDPTASAGSAVKFGAPSPISDLAGVFVARSELDRAKSRATATTQPFRSSADTLKGRADSALATTPSPFYMEQSNYLQNLRFAWGWSSCPDSNVNDNNSLSDAVSKLERQGDTTRGLALQYAISGDVRYADKAKQYLMAWSTGSTPVNMYDFLNSPPNFHSGLRGDDGSTCFRPYNMALDGLFQGYGLINFADAYALLKGNGYALSSTEDAAIRTYIKSLAAAVNSSFHAWMRWADEHGCTSSNTSETCIRYRSDNHLSWAQAPILAAAAALQDQTIANYVLTGSAWNDGKSGLYANSSPIKEVINRTVLATGRIYDEAPESEGGIARSGYAFYHLMALGLTARIAEVHYPTHDIWGYKGSDGKGLQEAYTVEGARVRSGAEDGATWQYEMVYNKWPTADFLSLRDFTGNRLSYIIQAVGPVVLLLGQ